MSLNHREVNAGHGPASNPTGMADRPAPKCVAISPGEVAEPNVVRTADPTRLNPHGELPSALHLYRAEYSRPKIPNVVGNSTADNRGPVGDTEFGELKLQPTGTISLSLFNPHHRSTQRDLQYT